MTVWQKMRIGEGKINPGYRRRQVRWRRQARVLCQGHRKRHFRAAFVIGEIRKEGLGEKDAASIRVAAIAGLVRSREEAVPAKPVPLIRNDVPDAAMDFVVQGFDNYTARCKPRMPSAVGDQRLKLIGAERFMLLLLEYFKAAMFDRVDDQFDKRGAEVQPLGFR